MDSELNGRFHVNDFALFVYQMENFCMRGNSLIQVFSISVRWEVIDPTSWVVNSEGRSFAKRESSNRVHYSSTKTEDKEWRSYNENKNIRKNF